MACRFFTALSGGLVVAAGVVVAGADAEAQFPLASDPPLSMAPGAITTGPDPVAVAEAPAATDTRIRYALPFLSEARRKARTANRYTVARPVYNGRPGVTFAPYSDYYFPRTIGARETVYTASPGAPVPTGYRAFANPAARTPILPR